MQNDILLSPVFFSELLLCPVSCVLKFLTQAGQIKCLFLRHDTGLICLTCRIRHFAGTITNVSQAKPALATESTFGYPMLQVKGVR